MSAPTASPTPERASAPAAPTAAGTGQGDTRPAPQPSETLLVASSLLLLAVAAAPLSRIFIGPEFARPAAAAVLLSVGIQVLTRRAGLGALAGTVVSAGAFAVFVALAFLPETTVAWVVPTLDTAIAGRDLWLSGIELIQNRPAPTFAEPGLLLLVVTGLWWVAHAVDLLAVRLAAPLHAVAAALVLWVVPLAVVPDGVPWRNALPLVLAALLLLLVAGDGRARRWGRLTRAGRGDPALAVGVLTAGAAVAIGIGFAEDLPGYGEESWVQADGATTTVGAQNPMVDLQANLVDQSQEPVARVRSDEPVYLRETSLERFEAGELWTGEGFSAEPAGTEPLQAEAQQEHSRFVEVEIESLGLSGSRLVPAPYQPYRLSGEVVEERFRWDASQATLTIDGDAEPAGIPTGESFTVEAGIPAPPIDVLADAEVVDDPALTELTEVPEAVTDLAEEIVADAGAETPYEQAMALQEELGSWEYTLTPDLDGHGSTAMEEFVAVREGYCEQYAGTMAVMLRHLDIPARVAVGYTPGERIGDDEFVIRGENRHAWVQVRFADHGWLDFEPTPRSDGNLLSPTADTVAPTELDAERQDEDLDALADLDPDQGELDDPDAEDPPEPDVPDVDADEGAEAASDAEADADGHGLGRAALLMLLAAIGLGAVARRSAPEPTVPSERVLARLAALEHLAGGLGISRQPADTDAELLGRIADAADLPRAVIDPLVEGVERSRWAREVPGPVADQAARAASQARRALLADRSARQRLSLRVRASLAALRRRAS